MIVCLSSSSLAETSVPIFSLFKEEIESADQAWNFEILSSSYAKFNFLGGFADGKYRLKHYEIKYIRDNIYHLDLIFEKKKGILKYGQKVSIFFWYFRNKMVFLTPKGKRKFILQDPVINIEKTSNGYRIVKTPQTTNIKLPLNNGSVYLKIMVR
jgi:hypothetical protein